MTIPVEYLGRAPLSCLLLNRITHTMGYSMTIIFWEHPQSTEKWPRSNSQDHEVSLTYSYQHDSDAHKRFFYKQCFFRPRLGLLLNQSQLFENSTYRTWQKVV